MNTLRTAFLMALLTVILVTVGGALGGEGGMMLAFVFALAMNGISYWFSDKMVLWSQGVREKNTLSPASAPRKFRLAAERTLSRRTR